MTIVYDLREPVERHIGSEHGNPVAMLIADGLRICAHHHLATALVKIGFAPVTLARLHGHGIPLHVVIVILVGAELFADNPALRHTIRIWCKLRSHLLIVVWLKGNGTAHYDFVVIKQTLGDGYHGTRFVEVALHSPCHLAHSHLYLVHHILNLEALDA